MQRRAGRKTETELPPAGKAGLGKIPTSKSCSVLDDFFQALTAPIRVRRNLAVADAWPVFDGEKKQVRQRGTARLHSPLLLITMRGYVPDSVFLHFR